MTPGDIISVVSVVCALVAMIFNTYFQTRSINRQKTKDERENTERLIRIDDNVRNISDDVNSLKADMRITKKEFDELNVKVAQHDTRLSTVENEVFHRHKEG